MTFKIVVICFSLGSKLFSWKKVNAINFTMAENERKIEKVENLKLVENLVKKYLLQESNRKLYQRKLS